VKTHTLLLRLTALAACIVTSVSCMTTYDANGRPVQSVDPAVAVAGAAAAGLVGYAIADGGHHHHHHGYYGPRYYGGGYYRGGYYRHR
jgi:hypothetical protein